MGGFLYTNAKNCYTFTIKGGSLDDFNYLPENSYYFDSACQSLRPQIVIDSLVDYYKKYNSCGERVKYKWGKKVDEKVDETRDLVLDLLKLKSKHYFVSFTLNTTYGINLLLSQLNLPVKKIYTSEIEHNSVFLPTMAFAEKHGVERVVLPREEDGSISLENDFSDGLVVVNAMNNVDGRRLENLAKLVKQIKKQGGFVILDCAQAMSANYELLQKVQADAFVSSAHKMYAPSLGVIVMRKDFAKFLEPKFIGGGTVASVEKNDYKLLDGDHLHAVLEPGLQAWGEIIALGEAIKWLKAHKKHSKIEEYGKEIFDFLKTQEDVILLNHKASSVISFYHKSIDSHLIAQALSDEGIMVRSGYFCAHYYLEKKLKLPHLVRISIGLHNTESDIQKLKSTLERIFE